MANTTIPDLSTLATISSGALLWINDPAASPTDRGILLKTIEGGKTPSSYNLNGITIPGKYQWTGQATTNYPTIVNACVLRLDGANATIAAGDAFVVEVVKTSSGELFQIVTDTDMVDANRFPLPGYRCIRYYDGTWGAFIPVLGVSKATTLGVSGGTLPPVSWDYFTNATTNPFVVNLPAAAISSGVRIRISNRYRTSATGLVRIVPYSGEQIENLGANVAIYLQTTDASGLAQQCEVELIADSTNSRWIAKGRYVPYQAVDTAGSDIVLGRYHQLPLENTTDRTLATLTPTGLTFGPTWSAAISASGTKGVPAGAKAVRLKVYVDVTRNSDSDYASIAIGFGTSSSYAPSQLTSHPFIAVNSAGSGNWYEVFEIDMPLNSNGAFYYYYGGGLSSASMTVNFAVMGYYLGD